jgi:protein-disulfide isomerase
MNAVVTAAASLTTVLALVNGQPITRADLERALRQDQKQAYQDATEDLLDAEHAAVRDFLGRQAVDRDAKKQRAPADSIYARVMARDFDRFDPNLRHRIQQERERVYEIERSALDAMIEKSLFEKAARARGMTSEELTRSFAGRVAPVTKQDVAFIKAYESSKDEASATVAPGEARLEAAIRNARIEQMRAAVIDSMREQEKVDSRLPAPRAIVSTTGASVVGSPTAPIHIVVFTDFECPYCLEMEQTLSRIRERYRDRVALFYLNFPLPSHQNARPAAIAALCAGAQGRYAAYHDLLFSHQQDLGRADYAGWAEGAGLDRKAFEACRLSGAMDKRVDQDIREGIAAGVNGTPTFLVNGRLVADGDNLEQVVAEEAAIAQ